MGNQLRIETAQHVPLGLQVASLGDRILAHLLDAGVKFIYIILVLSALTVLPGDFQAIPEYLLALFLSPIFFYHLVFEIFNHGQSPGKQVMQLQVVALSGGSASLSGYLFRWLFRLVDFQLFSGLVALIAIAVSKKGQRIGDLVGGTTVIKLTSQDRLKHMLFEDIREEHDPKYSNVHKLSTEEVQLIREVLDRSNADNLEPHVIKLAAWISRKLDVSEYANPRRFLRDVLNDYLYLNP